MANSTGIKVAVEGEQSFKKSIREINSSYKTLKTELKSVFSEFDKNDRSQKALSAQNEVLTKQIELQRKKIAETTTMVDKSTTAYGENNESTQRLQRSLNTTTADLNKLEAQLKSNNSAIALQSSKWTALGTKLDTTGAKMTSMGDGMANAGQKMTMGITVPLIALGTASVVAFKNVDDGMDTIIKKTGATGASAEDLEKIYKDLGSSVPEDLSDIGDAIGEINTRLGFTGDKLKIASEDFLKFAKVNDIDVNSAVQLVTRSMADAGIEADEYNSVLDMLTVAAQKSGIEMESLTTNLTKYGAPMRALGFDTETSIAMFAGWEKAGVNTEIAFSGMKKAISNWAAEGKDSKVEFQKTLDAIKSAPGIAEATSMAIDVFGQKAGPDLADAIQGGRFEINDYIEALENSGGVVESTYDQIESSTDNAKTAFNKIKIAGSELGETVLETLIPALEDVGDVIGDVADWYSDLNPEIQETILMTAGLALAAGPLLRVGDGLLKIGGTMLTTLGTVSAAMAVMTTGATAATPAIGGLATAMTFLTGPVGLVIVGVTALSVGLGALYIHKKNNTLQTKEQIKQNEKFIENNTAVTKSITTNLEAREKTLATTENEVVAAKTLSEKIFELSEKQNKSATETALMKQMIDEFNAVMPEANLLIDDQTGALNLTRDAVIELITVEEERIRLVAVSELLIQNAKDQLEATRQLNEAQTEANRLQNLENTAIAEAEALGGTNIQVKQRLNAAYAEYDGAIDSANASTDTLKTKQSELNAEQDKLNGLVSDPTGWDAYTTNTVVATESTTKFANNSNAELERWKKETAITATEGGQGISDNTHKGLLQMPIDAQVEAENANRALRDTFVNNRGSVEMTVDGTATGVKNKLTPLEQFAEDTGININGGLAAGMENFDLIGQAVGGAVEWIMGKFRTGFDMHSPARKMIPLGVNIIKGLFSGVNSLNLGDFADSMINKMLDSFKNGTVSAMSLFKKMGEDGGELLSRMGINLPSFGSLVGGMFPTNSQQITSGFGYRDSFATSNGEQSSSYHEGVDIGAPLGAAVKSTIEGEVVQSGWFGGYGKMITVAFENIRTIYAHLSQILVGVGSHVDTGQLIGAVGSTGNSTGPHLHYGVYVDGVAVDPFSNYNGYAIGTNNASPGVHWVGESGPELVSFAGGETVYTNQESTNMVNGDNKLLTDIKGLLVQLVVKNPNIIMDGKLVGNILDERLGAMI